MPDLEQIIARQRERNAEREVDLEATRKARKAVANQMEELRNSPQWEIYLAHLRPIMEAHEAKAESLRRSINSNFLAPDVYGQTFVEKVRNEAYAAGIKQAIEIVEQLIKTFRLTQ